MSSLNIDRLSGRTDRSSGQTELWELDGVLIYTPTIADALLISICELVLY